MSVILCKVSMGETRLGLQRQQSAPFMSDSSCMTWIAWRTCADGDLDVACPCISVIGSRRMIPHTALRGIHNRSAEGVNMRVLRKERRKDEEGLCRSEGQRQVVIGDRHCIRLS